jgi:hypothetical protein
MSNEDARLLVENADAEGLPVQVFIHSRFGIKDEPVLHGVWPCHGVPQKKPKFLARRLKRIGWNPRGLKIRTPREFAATGRDRAVLPARLPQFVAQWCKDFASRITMVRAWIRRATCAKDRTAMKPSDALATHRVALRQLIGRYNVAHPRVYGSVLTGRDTDESDLDLLVDATGSTTLFTLAGLEHEAEQLLGVPVSVLTPKFLSVKFRDKVLQQAEPL